MTIDNAVPLKVMEAWDRAVANPTLPAWRSVHIMAGSLGVTYRIANDDEIMAAVMEGISIEARARMIALQPRLED